MLTLRLQTALAQANVGHQAAFMTLIPIIVAQWVIVDFYNSVWQKLITDLTQSVGAASLCPP
jgi:hypothetical protein